MLCVQGRTGIKDVDGKLNCWIEEVEGFPIRKKKGTVQLGSYQPMCSDTQKTDFLTSRLISVKTR